MRMSQIVLEAWLKQIVQKEPLISDYWGYTFQSLIEHDDVVYSRVTDPSGKELVIKSKYVLGCDGGGSKVRANVGLEAKRRQLLVSTSHTVSC